MRLIGGPLKSFNFTQRQRISPQEKMQLHFPEEMNKESVLQSLRVPSDLRVEELWEGNTLVLTPDAPLAEGSTYEIRVDSRALQANGQPIGNEIVYIFQVSGAPVVTAQIPPVDATAVPTEAKIVIIFDRPMIPLTQVQNADSLRSITWPVKISPPTSGRWRWLGTTTAQFVPEKPLMISTKYTVSVPAGIRTNDGAVTEKDYSWSFETERPRLVSTDPAEGSLDAGPSTKIVLQFNQEIDLLSAEKSLHLLEKEKSKSKSSSGKVLQIKNIVYGKVEGEDGKMRPDKTVLIVEAAKMLRDNTAYSLIADGNLRGNIGNLTKGVSDVVHFETTGPLQITIAEYADSRLHLVFSAPIDDSSLQRSISMSPAVKDWDVKTLTTDSWNSNKELSVYPALEPSTKYTIKLAKGLTGKHGQKLLKEYAYTFTTPSLSPEVFVHPRDNDFSIFEKGYSPTFFINTLNVKDVTLHMGELSLDAFLQYRKVLPNDWQKTMFDMKKAQNVETIQLQLKSALNQWKSTPIQEQIKTIDSTKSGMYIFQVISKQNNSQGYASVDQRIFSVTNMIITLKYSGNQLLAWVTDSKTGNPVQDADIEVRSLENKVVKVGKTDKAGFYETQIDINDFQKNTQGYLSSEFWLIAKTADDLAFVGSDWSKGIEPGSFDGIYTDSRTPQSAKTRLLSSLYTERPLYRAGDEVHIKGITRFLDWNGKMSLPNGVKSAHVTVQDPEGKEVFSKDLPIDDFGTFHDSLSLSTSASLGYYSINASLNDYDGLNGQSIYSGFQVQAYRKPEYRVSVTPSFLEYFNHDTVKAEINGQYYFGGPMSESSVNWRVISSDYYFNKFTDGWYSFALQDSWCWRNCDSNTNIVTEGKGTLDASGKLHIQFPVSIDDKAVSQIMTIEADITDKNNQVVSNRSDSIIHKSNVYVGIKTDDHVVATGEKADVSIVTLLPDGKTAPKQSVELSLYSRLWNTVKEKGVDGEYYYDNKPVDTFIRKMSVTTNENGKLTVPVALDQGGEFFIVAATKDAKGREAKAGTSLYAWSSTYFNWPHSNTDRLEMIADKPTYKVGDTAKILVKSPYQGKGVKALVTVERENILYHKVFDVWSNALPLDIPIIDDMLPTAYVSVVIIKPRIGETFNEHGLDTGSPSFKVGYLKLPIDTTPKRMKVSISTNKEKYAPGETVTVKLNTTDQSGKPVPAELSLGVVDMSLLDLAGFQMPDLVENFYAERGLGVTTANLLVYLMERFKPGSKGGGGADPEGRARGTFRDTAYWNPHIVTDKTGQAKVEFKLPDNLTTWQILALGSTKSHLFGGQAKEIVETKQVILRPVRPRFAVVGDKIQIGAIVHNYLDETRSFTISLDGKGFSQDKNTTKTISIPKNGDTKVIFPITVQETGSIVMHFVASTAGARDEITETIPVYDFGIMQANGLSGVTEDQVTESIAIPSLKDASKGSLLLSIAPSIAIYLPSGLEYVTNFPYGCAEQVASSFLPNVVVKKLQGFDAFRITDDATLQKNVSAGIEKIYAFQKGNGGFGYWDNGEAYPALSAYILYALIQTKEAGFAVDQGVIERAQDYLNAVMHENNNQPNLDLATRAHILFVLSEAGKTDSALLANLLKKQQDLPIYARAYLAMAFQKLGTSQGRSTAKSLIKEIMSHAQVDARLAAFQEESTANGGISMNTNDRTTAIVLQSLVRIEPQNVLLPKVVRGVLESRKNGHWDTTQSTTASLLALIEYLQQTNELQYDFSAEMALDGKKILSHSYAKGKKLMTAEKSLPLLELEAGSTVSVVATKKGAGKLYYDMLLSYFYTPDSIDPAEEGIGIQREIQPLEKKTNGLAVGGTYKITLTITVPQNRHFVAVTSPLPAGMEAINLELLTSQQGLLQNTLNNNDQQNWWYSPQPFTHKEFRDDEVFLFADQLSPGVYTYEYLARATTPGTFRQRPAKVWEMYFPETFGQTTGEWVTIAE